MEKIQKEATKEIIVDAEGATVGRVGTLVAKKLLQGEKIVVINSEKAILVGDRHGILEDYLKKRRLGKGVQKGPFFYYQAEMILRKSIRGMLPWKRTRGREAYRQLICVKGVPEKYKDAKRVTFEKRDRLKFITLQDLSKLIKPNQK
ncbi:MAG: 50S ribosomal protein L13 [Candidatus Pacearchaeota archaeon]|nr:50S ribosomal protein L13 [Candidatus Pacearchaeota archaeon]